MTDSQRKRRFPPFLLIALSMMPRGPRAGSARTRKWRQRVNGMEVVTRDPVRHRRVSRDEVATRSHLSTKTVQRLTHSICWDAIPWATQAAFQAGCRIDLGNDQQPKRCLARAMRLKFRHLSADQYKVFLHDSERYVKFLAAA